MLSPVFCCFHRYTAGAALRYLPDAGVLSIGLQNGVDVKIVSSVLGHYDAGFTLRTHTHATRQKQGEAAQTMDSLMA